MEYLIKKRMHLFDKPLMLIKVLAVTSSIMMAQVQAEMVVIVNPDNPVESLSKKDVQRLFLGRMHQFPDTNMKVESIDNSESSEEYERFYATVINMNKSKLKRYRAYYLFSGKGRLPTQIESTQKILKYISITKNAIAYTDESNINNKVKVVYPE